MTGEAPLGRKLLAEAAGTFFITLLATAVDVAYYTGHGVDFVSRWLARGFVASAMIYAFSGVSGAHLDPVVSLAFWARGVFAPARMAAYVVAQFGGAIAAAALAYACWGHTIALGASHPGPAVSPLLAVGVEIVLTLLLVTVILATADQGSAVGKQAALAVGLTIAACGFAGGSLSGASMNPARSLAPQAFGGDASLMWIYAVGPSIGALLAVALAGSILGRPSGDEEKAAQGS